MTARFTAPPPSAEDEPSVQTKRDLSKAFRISVSQIGMNPDALNLVTADSVTRLSTHKEKNIDVRKREREIFLLPGIEK